MTFESLSSSLRSIASRLLALRPELRPFVGVAESDQRLLVIDSPTGDRERDIVLWDDDGDLGLGFGPWHTHGKIARWPREADDEESALVAIACSIVPMASSSST